MKKFKHRSPFIYTKPVDFTYFQYPEGFLNFAFKLRKKKWDSLKHDLSRKANRYWFLSLRSKNLETGRKRVKFSHKRRTIFFRSVKNSFFLPSSKQLKRHNRFVKTRTTRHRSAFLLNYLERRLITALVRSRFFHRLSDAALAIRRGDILVNNRPVCSVHFILTLQDIVSVQGLSRAVVRRFLYSLRLRASAGTQFSLFPDSSIRTLCPVLTQKTRSLRLALVLRRSIARFELFLLKENYRKNIPRRLRVDNHSRFRRPFFLWPQTLENLYAPDHLVVDPSLLLFFLKSTVLPRSLATFYHQNLCFSEFWRV